MVEEGNRLMKIEFDGIFEEILDQLGQMPLPPYITHQLEDKNRYQTVYATSHRFGSGTDSGTAFYTGILEEIKEKKVWILRELHFMWGLEHSVR